MRRCACISLICCALLTPGVHSARCMPSSAHGYQTTLLHPPRLIWKRVIPGQVIIKLGPGRTDHAVIYTSAIDTYTFTGPTAASIFDLTNGLQGWHVQVPSAAGSDMSGDTCWYVVAPQVSQSGDVGTEPERPFSVLAAYNWKDGSEAWRTSIWYGEPLLTASGVVLHSHSDGSGRGATVLALDAATGLECWRKSGRDIGGMYAANNLIYLYNEQLDSYGPAYDPAGDYLNGYEPKTGKPVHRFRFFDGISLNGRLVSFAWIERARVFVGTYAMLSTGTQIEEVRAFDPTGKLVWNRRHTGEFQAADGALICEDEGQHPTGNPDYDIASGIIGLDPATGHVLWRRSDLEFDEIFVWNGVTVARITDTLIGIDPRNGKTAWMLPLTVPRQNRNSVLRASNSGTHPPPDPDVSIRVYGPYLAVAEGKRADHSAGLRVFSFDLSKTKCPQAHSRTHKPPKHESEYQYGLNIWTHKLKSSDGYAQWSADGRALAVSFCRGNDKNRLLVLRRGKRVLDWNGSSFLAGEPIYKMAWSPDDRRLLIHIPPSEGSWDEHTGPLWCIDMATGRHRLIYRHVTYFSWIGRNTIRYRYKIWGVTGHPFGYGPEHLNVVRVR